MANVITITTQPRNIVVQQSGPQGPPGPAGAATISGTPHEINVANVGGNVTLSTPQPIDTTSAVQFASATLVSPTTITTPLIVQAASAQSANLVQFESSTGAVLWALSPHGAVGVQTANPGASAAGLDDTNSGIIDIAGVPGSSLGGVATIRMTPGATTGRWFVLALGNDFTQAARAGNLEFYDVNSTTPRFILDSSGQMNVGGGYNQPWTAQFSVWSAIDRVTLQLRAIAAQTSDVQQIRNSTGTVLSRMDANGAYHPSHLADAAAQNDSVYYSTTISGMAYKDSVGTVVPLSGGGGGGTYGNPVASVGWTVVNGSNAIGMRNDGAPPINRTTALFLMKRGQFL